MTIADRVKTKLEQSGWATNYNLAFNLNVPEPSVRRVTGALVKQGIAKRVGDGFMLVPFPSNH